MTNLASPPMIRRLHSALLFSFKPSPRSWKGLLPPASLPLPDTLASSTAISVAPSLRSHSTRVLPSRTQSSLYNTQPSKSHRCSLTSRVALTMLMPTSFTPPYAPRGLTLPYLLGQVLLDWTVLPPFVPSLPQDIFSCFCWHPPRVPCFSFVICYLCSSLTHPA